MPANREFLLIFDRASRKTPGSYVGQAAYLALQAINNNEIPSMLKHATTDQDTIETVSKMAENAHKLAIKNDSSKEKKLPTSVKRGRTKDILKEELKLLPRMQKLPREKLEHIIWLFKAINNVAAYEMAVLEDLPE